MWWLDFTVKGCRCGKCKSGRHRQPSKFTVKKDAEDLLDQRCRDYAEGRYEVQPQPKTLTAMVHRVYGHLGSVRKRGRVVEYRLPPQPVRHTLRHTGGRVG